MMLGYYKISMSGDKSPRHQIGGYHNYLQEDDALIPSFSRIPVSRSLGDFDNGGKKLIRII